MPGLYSKDIKDYKFDPIKFRKQVLMSYKTKEFKDNFFGPSPAPFIGRFNYPNINVGFLSLDEAKDASLHDAPKEWNKQNFSIQNVAEKRVELNLINCRKNRYIKHSIFLR